MQNENLVSTNAVHPWNFRFDREVSFFSFFFFCKENFNPRIKVVEKTYFVN